MSGIEVAGLLLGAFPIAIWALEQYRDVAKVMGFWYEIRLEYQRCSNELKFHRLSFIRNLKRLLLPLVPNDAQLQALINEPGGPAWKDAEIQMALEARLQDSYELYLEILGEMQRAMQELNQELAVESNAIQSKVAGDKGFTTHMKAPVPAASRLRKSFDRSNRDYQVFRVKFSMGERTRTRLFSELQTYNDRLEKLMTLSDVVSDLDRSREQDLQSTNSKSAKTTMSKFWNTADKLYKALLDAWGCSCRDHHRAQLVLQHRAPGDRDFHMYLEAGSQEAVKRNGWSACSVTLRALEQPLPKAAAALPPVVESTCLTASVSISTPQRETEAPRWAAVSGVNKGKKRVQIAETQPITKTVTIRPKNPEPPTPTKQPTSTGTPTSAEKLITDLCHALGAKNSPTATTSASTPLGHIALLDSEIHFSIHINQPTPPMHPPHISLSQLFLDKPRQPLTRRQRYRLSLTLASSFVQLQDTAWLQTRWDKRNVYFFASSPANTRIPSVDSPFIASQFNKPDPNLNPGAQPNSSPTTDVAGIACLGILLLELCFGVAIEQHPSWLLFQAPGDQTLIRAGLSLVVALEWLKEVNDEAGADYTDAVAWCLAGCRTLSGDGSWRKLMVEKVVEPLQRCCTYLG
ncbi:hypothetical protein B0T22DRAFT_434709 [Podospora appendiculata]|uniref:DUF7580 domain-containing protein n=1 Tax=Podospora appendiculata TaxID=314037 RepID=A0AAE0WYQ0_9PEZI|nr:hypothetical protein B0T22DRAFT_434709 [Podospora appendiculata]